MTRTSLRTASIYCLAIWAAIWLLYLLIRFSRFDIRVIPGIGPIMLMSLVVVVVAPIAATGISGLAAVRQPRALLNWLIFGCATVTLVGQVYLFINSRWL
jgi:hypothetical protein